ncbi:flavodoxin domain-containing protein [Ciceribacter thiooxidans]|uniref:Flavodoxin domain-containing protein n=1 Tax=Ciceribacter thiooxidans TaxID=1969821 RepID=A0ABV7I0P2_9HYPH|nr:flavodoxin domain-containing protein [Ciceribacter thiooxidans]MDI6835569.1 flavodoxin domain-containing protein [Rhizobiaceae bacterium]
MNILIGFVSIEGQTRKIAEKIAEHVEKAGHRAVFFNVTSMAEYALERPEAVILCAPIHAGRYPAPFVDFVRRERDFLKSVPSAFVSVSLFIRSEFEEEREEARHFPDTLMAETGWTPGRVLNAAGALRYTEYDFFKRWMAKRLAAREGAPTDASQNFEFTDWAELERFVADFLAGAKA